MSGEDVRSEDPKVLVTSNPGSESFSFSPKGLGPWGLEVHIQFTDPDLEVPSAIRDELRRRGGPSSMLERR